MQMYSKNSSGNTLSNNLYKKYLLNYLLPFMITFTRLNKSGAGEGFKTLESRAVAALK